MVGVKGKSGRKRMFNDEWHRANRNHMLEYYYKNREKRLAYGKRYHKRIKDYADEHNISFEEARKIVGNQKTKETEK